MLYHEVRETSENRGLNFLQNFSHIPFLYPFFAIKKTPCIKLSCTLTKKRELYFALCFDTSVTDSRINCVLRVMWCNVTYIPQCDWRSVSHVASFKLALQYWQFAHSNCIEYLIICLSDFTHFWDSKDDLNSYCNVRWGITYIYYKNAGN